jgi:predicted GNAT family N-acyltransferase
VRLVEPERVTSADWERIVAGEPEPFGSVGEGLLWRNKTHHVGVRDEAGNLIAIAGLVLADVRVGAEPPLQVAGVGGVIVTKAARGRGLARTMIERLLEVAPQLGADRAMLFCLPANMGLYAKFGFRPIAGPVWAQQPSGPVEVPMQAMWKPLRAGVGWPDGPVELVGEPF